MIAAVLELACDLVIAGVVAGREIVGAGAELVADVLAGDDDDGDGDDWHAE